VAHQLFQAQANAAALVGEWRELATERFYVLTSKPTALLSDKHSFSGVSSAVRPRPSLVSASSGSSVDLSVSILEGSKALLLEAAKHVMGLFGAAPDEANGGTSAPSLAACCKSLVNRFDVPLACSLSVAAEIALERAMRCFVHESAVAAIEGGQSDFLAELRPVVASFIEIKNVTMLLGTNELQQIVSAILRSVALHGGSLRQIVLDDKGFVAVTAFGLSGSCYDDDCYRSVELAFLIRNAISEIGLGLDARIGITSGQAYCGNVGSTVRCEFAMMGRSVNLAARLMKSAEGVLVDETIYRATEDNGK